MPRTGIAGRAHSGLTAESIDHQTGVIGETVVAVAVAHPAGFSNGIPLYRRLVLGYVVMTAYVGQRQHLESVTGYSPYFIELVGVVCRKYNPAPHFTTTLTILRGTTITFTTCLPSIQRAAFSWPSAAASTSFGSMSAATVIL